MVKSFKKKTKKKLILFILYDFQKILNCFFPSFNSKIETWLICEAQAQVLQWITSKSIQSFCALKKFKPNRIQQAQPNTQHITHNTQHTHTHIVLAVQQDPKKIFVMNARLHAREHSVSVWTGLPNLKRQKQTKKKKKREWKLAKLANHILTDHSSTSKKKKKKMLS